MAYLPDTNRLADGDEPVCRTAFNGDGARRYGRISLIGLVFPL